MPLNYTTFLSAALAIMVIFTLNNYSPKFARALLFLILLVLIFNHAKEIESMLPGGDRVK
jgi:hypothetical protein